MKASSIYLIHHFSLPRPHLKLVLNPIFRLEAHWNVYACPLLQLFMSRSNPQCVPFRIRVREEIRKVHVAVLERGGGDPREEHPIHKCVRRRRQGERVGV